MQFANSESNINFGLVTFNWISLFLRIKVKYWEAYCYKLKKLAIFPVSLFTSINMQLVHVAKKNRPESF